MDALADLLHGVSRTGNFVWDTDAMAWVRMTQPGGSTPGGGAVTIADGADVAEGTTTDSAWGSGAGFALLKM